MATIFICYRRADSGGHAGRLYDHLIARFGKHRVYMDIDSIPPGSDFVEEVQKTLKECAAVIVLIGQHWLSGENRNRLNLPGDFVHQEIAQALKSKAKVFPVLVHGAKMPSEHELPRDIQGLARKHAIEIRDVSFAPDVQQLARALERLEGLKPARATRPKGGLGSKPAKPEQVKATGEGGGGSRPAKRGARKGGRATENGADPSTPRVKAGSGTGKQRVAGKAAQSATKSKPREGAADSSKSPVKRARTTPPPADPAPKAGGGKQSGAGGSTGGSRPAKRAPAKQTGGQRAKSKGSGPPAKGRTG